MAKKRFQITMDEELYEKMKYWVDKKGLHRNEYIIEAIERQIRWEVQDYDLAPLEIARLEQLIDHMAEMSNRLDALSRITTTGFKSLLDLTRGDNYLMDEDIDE